MPRTPQIARWQQDRADAHKREHGNYPEWYEAIRQIASAKAKAAKAAARPRTGKARATTSGDTDYEGLLLLQIKQHGLPEPQTQYRWHPTRRFRADFAYPALRLLIEVQGGLFQGGGGGHNRGASYEKDREKYNEAQLLGWRVLEFGPNHVTKGEAIRIIERALETFV